jgi:hypothetical protein
MRQERNPTMNIHGLLSRSLRARVTALVAVAALAAGCASETPESVESVDSPVTAVPGDGPEWVPIVGGTIDTCKAAGDFDKALRDLIDAIKKLDDAIAAEKDPEKKKCLERLRASITAQWNALKKTLEERFGPGLGNMTYCLKCEMLIGGFPVVGPLICKASIDQPTKVLADAVAAINRLIAEITGGMASCLK